MTTNSQQMMCMVGTPEQVAEVLRGLGFGWPTVLPQSNVACAEGSHSQDVGQSFEPAADTKAAHAESSLTKVEEQFSEPAVTDSTCDCFDIGDHSLLLPGDGTAEWQHDEQYEALGLLGCGADANHENVGFKFGSELTLEEVLP